MKKITFFLIFFFVFISCTQNTSYFSFKIPENFSQEERESIKNKLEQIIQDQEITNSLQQKHKNDWIFHAGKWANELTLPLKNLEEYNTLPQRIRSNRELALTNPKHDYTSEEIIKILDNLYFNPKNIRETDKIYADYRIVIQVENLNEAVIRKLAKIEGRNLTIVLAHKNYENKKFLIFPPKITKLLLESPIQNTIEFQILPDAREIWKCEFMDEEDNFTNIVQKNGVDKLFCGGLKMSKNKEYNQRLLWVYKQVDWY